MGRREDLGCQRGHENDPFHSEERAFRDLMSAFYSFPQSLSPSSFGRLRQLLDDDETQGERRPRLACDPDQLIDQSTLRSFAQHTEQIDRFAVGAQSTGMPPTCPHDNIGASVDDLADAVGL
jgi:hypothetical protein